MPTNHGGGGPQGGRNGGGGVLSKKAGKKNKCGLLLFKLQASQANFPECFRPLQRPIVESLQMCVENLTGELPCEEAF